MQEGTRNGLVLCGYVSIILYSDGSIVGLYFHLRTAGGGAVKLGLHQSHVLCQRVCFTL